jgi:3-oxoacyl-[acyl-carrier protein] reductase
MKKIVITGASSEIGQSIACRMAELNLPMLLQGNRNTEVLARLIPQASVVAADFSSPASLETFISQLNDTYILINAAVFTDTELLPHLSEASIDRMIAVNITALIRICKAVIPSMCIRRKGIIVNLSSVTASKVYRGQSVYAGTKAFMETFSKAIAAEYGRKGIRCNCIAPGGINSGSLKLLSHIAGDQVRQFNASARLGEPDDVASAVAFLCREENTFINGTVIHVDGGQWMGL